MYYAQNNSLRMRITLALLYTIIKLELMYPLLFSEFDKNNFSTILVGFERNSSKIFRSAPNGLGNRRIRCCVQSNFISIITTWGCLNNWTTCNQR